jgi:hypothetical protein
LLGKAGPQVSTYLRVSWYWFLIRYWIKLLPKTPLGPA